MGKICKSKKGSEKRNCGIKKLPVLLQAVFLRSLTAHIPQRVRISALLLLRSVKRLVLDFRLFTHQRKKHYIVSEGICQSKMLDIVKKERLLLLQTFCRRYSICWLCIF
jgi:hypothetical protein